jgi:hypothetical protein
MCNIHQDVKQVIGQISSKPKESHVLEMKRIFIYIKGIEEFGLWYPKGKDLSLIAYTNEDWAGCIVDTERGVNQYQVQFKNLFQLILKPFNYIQ